MTHPHPAQNGGTHSTAPQLIAERSGAPALTARCTDGDGHDAGLVVLSDGGAHRLPQRFAELLGLPAAELRAAVENATASMPIDPDGLQVLAPIEGRAELWAAGVTYQVSRSARMAESERSATVYDEIYDADRPELFFKSVAWRVRGPGESIGIRTDSEVDVPEPELAVLVNAYAEIVGFGVCNDVSSRTIEGENPLYLPQAKVYRGSAALGPGIVWAWDVADPYALTLGLEIHRGGELAWSGSTDTGQLHRRLDELVGWLFAAMDFPEGAWLSTGTSLVPDLPFTLQAGDRVAISIPGVGTLTNDVVDVVTPAGGRRSVESGGRGTSDNSEEAS